ncbi:ornithine cyclodeaminase family protein [Rhodoligotrophos defluvii]|uniref:ornithine cyclodeaminase family protein n=1 Tax=Rhodoligotrophos defluvii TaxID=2561934 RepID=UPI0010C96B37|nr:ornithine cyclodeaminase family protein [Rhodoligotrophos defluvii]
MQIVDAETVHRLLRFEGLVEALAAKHRLPEPLDDRSELHHEGEGETPDTFFVLPAWTPGEAFGCKLVTVMPANPRKPAGLPAVQGSYILFDGETGSPAVLIDGTVLTYYKTAADSGLGAKLLARPDVETLLVCGAGALAPYLVRAHLAVRPSLRRVLVWNRTPRKARALAAELCGSGVAAEVAEKLDAAVGEADVISCATAATTPYIRGAWLKPGQHLDLVGSFTPAMRECDDEAVRRSRLYCDSRRYGIDQPGDLGEPLRRGVIERSDIIGDLFDLCQSRVEGRKSPGEITLFKNGGGGHLDLFTAMHVRDRLCLVGAV